MEKELKKLNLILIQILNELVEMNNEKREENNKKEMYREEDFL